MTTFRPNDDPAPVRGADAQADALDALLNGIAHEYGSPASRTGRGSAGPNARSDRNAAAGDVLDSARAFHRRFAAAEARSPGAAGPDPQLWEQIMASTSPPAARVARTHGAVSRSSRSVATPVSRRPLPRLVSHSWQAFGNATLALLVILAGFGLWRVYDDFNGGTPQPEATVPGLAMQPGPPDGNGVSVGTPAATPTPTFACDLSADIPIFPDVDTSPIDGAALLLTTAGDLILTCPEEPEPIVLATGLALVGPAGWPGIVGTSTGLPEDGAFQLAFIDIATGESIDVGFSERMHQYTSIGTFESPWLVRPSADDPAQWAITDFRTMQSRLLSDLVGSDLPDESYVLASASASGALAIAHRPWISSNSDEMNAQAATPDRGRSAGILIVDGSFADRRWIPLPDDLPLVWSLTLSPDGAHVALQGLTFISLLRTSDGHEIGRVDGTFGTESDGGMTWVQDGRALAWMSGRSLLTLATGGDGTPVTVWEGDADLASLRPTYDPDVVLVTRTSDHMAPGQSHSRIFSVNTVTGEVIEIEGVHVSDNREPVARFLVTGDAAIHATNGETASFRVVDAVTGEIVGEIADVTITQNPLGPDTGLRSVASTHDGSVKVVGFDASHIYVIQMAQDGVEIRRLPALDVAVDTYVDSMPIRLSDDGTMLSLTIDGDESGTRYLLDLTDPDSQWVAVPTPAGTIEAGSGPTLIYFAPGTGD
jgi:hypothetical protein